MTENKKKKKSRAVKTARLDHENETLFFDLLFLIEGLE